MKANETELKNIATVLLDTINKLKALLSLYKAENLELRKKLSYVEWENKSLKEELTDIAEALASGKIC